MPNANSASDKSRHNGCFQLIQSWTFKVQQLILIWEIWADWESLQCFSFPLIIRLPLTLPHHLEIVTPLPIWCTMRHFYSCLIDSLALRKLFKRREATMGLASQGRKEKRERSDRTSPRAVIPWRDSYPSVRISLVGCGGEGAKSKKAFGFDQVNMPEYKDKQCQL